MGLHARSTRSRVSRMMSRVALLLPLIAAASAAPEARFSCEECVREMHGLAAMVKMGAIPIHDYIRDNYCPTLDSTAAQHFCEDSLSKYYVGMLFAVVEHWFVDGALHVCQTAGTCDAREYTCDECIQGLEWVEAYLEDPIMIAEFRIYLEQNFCLSDWDDCSWWRSTSPACTPWPWRSSSSPQRSACRSQCAEEAPPCPPSPPTALMPNSPTQINAGINTRV